MSFLFFPPADSFYCRRANVIFQQAPSAMSKPAADLHDDEYVAKLLAEDARRSSSKYASQGLSALLPQRRAAGSGLKPNTRFLRTLVREVDSHNAALKKKEELEARARLRSIQDSERRSRNDSDRDRKGKDHGSDHRRYRDEGRERERERARERGKERDGERGHDRKRRRLSDDGDNDGRRRARREERHERSRKTRRRSRSRSRSPEQEESRSRSRSREKRRRDKRPHDEASNKEKRSSRHEKGSEQHPTKSSRRSRSRSRSMSRSRSRSPAGHRSKRDRSRARDRDEDEDDDHKSRHRNRNRNRNKPHSGSRSVSSASASASSDSDPLSSIVGPDPADHKTTTTIRRGRGFTRDAHGGGGGQSSSNIDAHFSSTYNPALDVDPDPESSDDADGADMDMDNALEALRDRRAWRAKQADRLREAGFDEDEIDRWKKTTASLQKTRLGDDDGDVPLREVRWKKTGEQREWDAGKPAFGGVEGTSEDDDNENEKTIQQGREKKPKKRGAETFVAEAWRRKDNGMLKQFRNALG
ncbi:hypothetical protein LTS03_004727 [Exophiala xenobiotica]|nr:hypothetical protein LTS03_004727 [Exophiala xenobiotica]KAK5389268.1 hypothetical protein LTR11_000078 [Exophiala xenobiotica]